MEAIASIAAKTGCSGETLYNRVRGRAQSSGRGEDGAPDQERLKPLEQENRDLRRVKRSCAPTSAYFAQAEREPTEVMITLIDNHRQVYGPSSLPARAGRDAMLRGGIRRV